MAFGRKEMKKRLAQKGIYSIQQNGKGHWYYQGLRLNERDLILLNPPSIRSFHQHTQKTEKKEPKSKRLKYGVLR